MLGHELSDVASWGVVSGTIRAELREGKEAARQVANLTLFGPSAKLDLAKDDVPVVQVLKELARLYRDAAEAGDMVASGKALATISTTLSQHESRRGTRMDAAMRLLIEQAKYQVKMAMHGGKDPMASDLEAILADQDAQVVAAAIEAKAAEDEAAED